MNKRIYTTAQLELIHEDEYKGQGFGLAKLRPEGGPIHPEERYYDGNPKFARLLFWMRIDHWPIWQRWYFSRQWDYEAWYVTQRDAYLAFLHPQKWNS